MKFRSPRSYYRNPLRKWFLKIGRFILAVWRAPKTAAQKKEQTMKTTNEGPLKRRQRRALANLPGAPAQEARIPAESAVVEVKAPKPKPKKKPAAKKQVTKKVGKAGNPALGPRKKK